MWWFACGLAGMTTAKSQIKKGTALDGCRRTSNILALAHFKVSKTPASLR